MRRILNLSLHSLTMFLLVAGSAFGTTYYVAGSGSDANSGNSKTAPWLHAPGMANCTGICSTATISAGDQIIFRGGDTWGSASFVWNWSRSGASGNYIYIGVDRTWFSGSSWTRPIMDCQNVCNKQLSLGPVQHVQIDNLEWRGLFDNNSAPAYASIYSINSHALGNDPDVIVSNNYFHGWNILHDNSQDAEVILWSTGATDTNSQVYNNVADGSDATGNAPHVMCFLYGSPGKIFNNYAGHMSNGYINGSNFSGGGAWVRSFHDNIVEYIFSSVDSATHENMFESIGDGGTIAYNNIIRHGQFTGLVVLELAPYPGSASYGFNNVLYDIYSPNGQQCYENAPAGGTCNFFNNTNQCGPIGTSNIACGRATGTSHGNFINEHFITSVNPPISGSNVSITSPVSETESAATSQGFTSTETYAYAPNSESAPTVGLGVNEQTLCTAIMSIDPVAGAACKNDTTYACTYDTNNHTMNCPARSVVILPLSAAWNIGAYKYAPNPPTGLVGTVN